MTGAELRAAGQIIWGDHHMIEMAEWLDTSLRGVQRWVSGERPIPPGVADTMINAVRVAIMTPSRSSPAIEVIRLAMEPARAPQGS